PVGEDVDLPERVFEREAKPAAPDRILAEVCGETQNGITARREKALEQVEQRSTLVAQRLERGPESRQHEIEAGCAQQVVGFGEARHERREQALSASIHPPDQTLHRTAANPPPPPLPPAPPH